MEFKITKQNVNVSNKVLSQMAERQLDTQVMLPDFCTDIKRLLKCKVSPCVTLKSFSTDVLSVEGEACISVYYVDDSNCIKCYEHREPFSHSFDLPMRVDMGVADVTAKASYVNCRAVNERRADVRCSIQLNANVKSCVPTEIVTDIDEPTVLMQRGSAESSTMVGFDEKFLMVSDEMSVGERDESIKNILRTDSRVLVSDKKIIGNKIVIKGELLVNFLYIGEESDACCTASEAFPFSQILDIAGLNDSCTCTVKAQVTSCEIRPQSDMSGMLRKAMVNAKIHISTHAYCNAQIPYLTDAYSTEKNLDLEYRDINFENVVFSVNEPYLINKKLDIPTENIDRIIDVWNDVQMTNATHADKCLMVKGMLTVYVLALDNSGEAMFFERTVDFDFTRETGKEIADWELSSELTPLNTVYSLSRGDVEIKAEINIRVDIIECTMRKVVTNTELGEKLNRKYSNSSIVIYRAMRGETLWDIAKRYGTSVEAIRDLNSIDAEAMSDDKTVVIPVGNI